jgi:hypothetical protein
MSEFFRKEVVDDRTVCDNCYLRKGEILDTSDRWSRGVVPDEIYVPREDNTERENGERFCNCGSSKHAQIRPRSTEMAVRHARNLAQTLSEKGYDVDLGTLVLEVRRLKNLKNVTGNEDSLIFPRAVKEALK